MNGTIDIAIIVLAVLGLALYMNAQRQMGPTGAMEHILGIGPGR